MDIAFHCNFTQPHQIEHAQWLRAGLARHGLTLTVTPDIEREADIHIVSGPHYAKARWLEGRTLLLDRAIYHNEKPGRWHSMDWVSLGWMNPDGGRTYKVGTGRAPPERKPLKTEGGTIFLADWHGKVEQADTIRLHPDDARHDEPLLDVLARHRHAIGYQTTALVTAALEGLTFECMDHRNILANDNWLDLLPYADWRFDEIENGEAWAHLQ